METLKNAADYLTGMATQTVQSGKEPKTSPATGAGGPEPFDPGNKEDIDRATLSSASRPTTAGEPAAGTSAAEKPQDTPLLGSSSEVTAKAADGVTPSTVAHTDSTPAAKGAAQEPPAASPVAVPASPTTAVTTTPPAIDAKPAAAAAPAAAPTAAPTAAPAAPATPTTPTAPSSKDSHRVNTTNGHIKTPGSPSASLEATTSSSVVSAGGSKEKSTPSKSPSSFFSSMKGSGNDSSSESPGSARKKLARKIKDKLHLNKDKV